MKKILLSITILSFFFSQSLIAQTELNGPEDRVITTALDFLLVPGDARASGMGDMGVATPTSTYAQQWNAAKYAFAKKEQGVGLSYVPYLRELVNDINVGKINYYNRINERSAFAASLTYFNLGEIEARRNALSTPFPMKPNQFAVDLSYALRLSETFSMGVTGRYIRSDLKLQTAFEDASAANTFAVDISGYYRSEVQSYENFDGRWRAGFNISNIGTKIKYSDGGPESFIPTKLSLGGGFDFILDQDNTIGAYIEFDKLLVPTPLKPNYIDANNNGQIDASERNQAEREAADQYDDISAISGIFKSFGDAPGGIKEELKEVKWAVGAEYRYKDSFAFRMGYFHESPVKGYRQYLTLGAGFTYSMAEINVSYLFSTSKAVSNPLEGSLRFSLAFNFGGTYKN